MSDVILVLAVIGVTIYAFVDCLRSADSEIRGLPKPVWLLAILVMPLFGGILWLLLGRAPAPGPRPPARRLRTSGPDDDPDFLRSLNRPGPRRLDDDGDPKS